MSETIQLTETSRLRIEQDEDATNPRTDGSYMMTGFVKIGMRGDSRYIDVAPIYDFPGNIQRAVDELEGPHYARGWTDTIERWARIFHGMHIEYDSTHGGYWFVDPTEFAKGMFDGDPLQWQAKIIEGERHQYVQWGDGEVYGVILERAKTYAQLPIKSQTDATGLVLDYSNPKIIVEWEEAESLWGCYLDDRYTAEMVAVENFELTDEEMVPLADIAGVGPAPTR